MAKIVLGKAKGVVPPLAHLIDKVANKRPHYEFVALYFLTKDTGEGSETWVTKVTVYDGPDIVGHLSFGEHRGKENKDGEYPEAFGITSHKVKKERGERDTLITTDPSAAVRQALKLLGKKPNSAILHDIIERMRRGTGSIMYHANYGLRELVNYQTEDMALILVEHMMFNTPLKLPKPFMFNKDGRGNYDRYLAAKQINEAACDARSVRGYAVSFLRDNSIRVVNLHDYRNEKLTTVGEDFKCMTHYRGFDELPKYIQERVAVLKIAEHREPVFNMGVKVSTSEEELQLFYVLPETDIQEYRHENAATV